MKTLALRNLKGNSLNVKLTVAVINPEGMVVICGGSVDHYIFDLHSNRYLKTYDWGYTSGKDNNDDTPTVTAGICTKISP
jgi:hypothetical protein